MVFCAKYLNYGIIAVILSGNLCTIGYSKFRMYFGHKIFSVIYMYIHFLFYSYIKIVQKGMTKAEMILKVYRIIINIWSIWGSLVWSLSKAKFLVRHWIYPSFLTFDLEIMSDYWVVTRGEISNYWLIIQESHLGWLTMETGPKRCVKHQIKI